MKLHQFLPLAWQYGPPPTNVRVVLADGREIPATLERTGRRSWLATVTLPADAFEEGPASPRIGMLPAKTNLEFRALLSACVDHGGV